MCWCDEWWCQLSIFVSKIKQMDGNLKISSKGKQICVHCLSVFYLRSLKVEPINCWLQKSFLWQADSCTFKILSVPATFSLRRKMESAMLTFDSSKWCINRIWPVCFLVLFAEKACSGWILYVIIPFEKRESGSNSQELVFQMIGKCKIAKLQNCRIRSCQFCRFTQCHGKETEEKRNDRRDMLVHCWVFLLASDVRVFRVGLINRAQAFQAVGALQWQVGGGQSSNQVQVWTIQAVTYFGADVYC